MHVWVLVEEKGRGDRVNATSCDACRCECYLVRVDFTARPEGNINSEKSRNNNKRADRGEKKERKQGSEMLSGPKPQIKI